MCIRDRPGYIGEPSIKASTFSIRSNTGEISSLNAQCPYDFPFFSLQEKQLVYPTKLRSYRLISSVSTPLEDAPSRALFSKVAVFHCFLGLPLIANTFIFFALQFIICLLYT